MRRIICVGMLAFLAGCGSDDDSPAKQFTIEPQLDFISVHYIPRAGEATLDTITVKFGYRDGDSDIGLTEADIESPYQAYNFFLESGSTLVPIPGERIEATYNGSATLFILLVPGAATGTLATLDSREKPAFSSIPPLQYPYTCLHYRAGDVLVAASDKRILDETHDITDSLTMQGAKYYILSETENVLYSQRNENALNLYIDFLVEQNDGTFTEFDFTRDIPNKLCTPGFDARLPLLSALAPGHHQYQVFDFDVISEKEGEITYAMASSGFQDLFIGKNIKLRVSLKDRALHTSNTLETSVFRVQ